MIEDEDGPEQTGDDSGRDPAGTTGEAAKQEDEISPGERADESGDGVQGAIDVGLAHDRAS